MPQPNSGRIGRSPGAVPRITRIASRTSSSSWARARPPRASTRSGKAMPDAEEGAAQPSCTWAPLTDTVPWPGWTCCRALDGHARPGVDGHGRGRLDRDRAVLLQHHRRVADLHGQLVDRLELHLSCRPWRRRSPSLRSRNEPSVWARSPGVSFRSRAAPSTNGRARRRARTPTSTSSPTCGVISRPRSFAGAGRGDAGPPALGVVAQLGYFTRTRPRLCGSSFWVTSATCDAARLPAAGAGTA